MEEKEINILGIPFVDTTVKDMVCTVKTKVDKKKKCFIVTANPEIVMYANKNDKYKNVVLSSDYIVPDGVGIIFASRILKTPLTERVAGFDLMTEMLTMANDQSYRIFLLGAEKEVILKAVENINNKYDNINIVGFHHGFFKFDDQKIVEMVKNAQPDIVFVALGFPRQEYWIHNNLEQFEKGIFMGVGGSFDVLSGKVKRAPQFWREFNMEWFYRLLKQPFRWKRVLQLPLFIVKIFSLKLQNRK